MRHYHLIQRPTLLLIALGVCLCAHSKDLPDPLNQITTSFPKSIALHQKQRLLEFCPDNTCDAFVAARDVSVTELKDFAYLYIYFLSDYYALQEWRNRDQSRNTAESVLSRPEYRNCRGESSGESARCVLRQL